MLDRSQVQRRPRRLRWPASIGTRLGAPHFHAPGRRLRLHPDDLYALGAHRGGINERWFSSTTNADNGPGTPADEGLSYVRLANGKRFLLKEAVEAAGDLLLGSTVMNREGGWNLLCKFFDNMGPIPHHMHQTDAQAQAGRPQGQARGVLLPAAIQPARKQLPVHVHGSRAGDDERRRAALPGELEQGRQRHPLSVARLQAAAGHRLADRSRDPARAGVARHLRAAGRQRRLRHVPVDRRGPRDAREPADQGRAADKHEDLDFLVGMLDWDANVDDEFAKHNRVFPIPARPFAETEPQGFREQWVCYGTGWYSAKELTVFPKRAVTITRQRGLRDHPDAGPWHVRRAPRLDAGDDSLRRHDGRRVVRQRRGGAAGCADREPERERSAGDPEALRPGQSRRRAVAQVADGQSAYECGLQTRDVR